MGIQSTRFRPKTDRLGYSPGKLRAQREPVDFARGFMEQNKPVFAICHGAQLLITADVLRGRRSTGWKSIKEEIINAGAEYSERKVVKDSNLVTSRQPGAGPRLL